jgi:hypothetical protein
VPLSEFETALRSHAAAIASLEPLKIDDHTLNIQDVSDRLWHIVKELNIVENNAKLVAGTKTLHHLLPDLVVPIDRVFTGGFFGWHGSDLQYRQRGCLVQAAECFARVARAVNPAQYVGDGWNTTRTKVIDNALVGLFIAAKEIAIP